MKTVGESYFEREQILEGIDRLAELAREADKNIDIAIFGGSAIVIEWGFRKSTRDVDVYISGDKEFTREAARRIASEKGWPEDWLNDAVKGFLSPKGQFSLFGEFPHGTNEPSLRIYIPKPEYLLAMKCMAMRMGGDDVADIEHLVKILGFDSPETVLDLVETFYPATRIHPKVMFGIRRIFEELERNDDEKTTEPPGGGGKRHTGRKFHNGPE